MSTTPQSFVKAAIAAEREQWTGVDKLADAIDRDSFQLAVQQDVMSAQHTPGPVTEADIQAGREHIADVHNSTQMLSACSQLRPEVVMELAARGLVPSFYAKAIGSAS